jgi:hypothetical protein
MMNNGSSNNGMDKEFVEERVTFVVVDGGSYVPRISVSRTVDRIGRAKVDKTFRPMETDDIQRILDFENVPDPPADGPMMLCEGEKFPSRHFCLRGGFLFYFDLADVSGTGASHYITYDCPPIGVIPLDKVKIELPPGGRRVFREHAQTEARTGYELAIWQIPGEDKKDGARPPMFVAAESLGQRDKWAAAIKARAGVENHTKLRAQAFGGGAASSLLTKPAEILRAKESSKKEAAAAANESSMVKEKKSRKGKQRTTTPHGKKEDNGDGEENVIQEALQEFGKNNFVEKTWIDNYFETHNEVDAASRCRQMENWQDSIKKGLKNAVLEQYEYFVEASGEMTKMGQEVIDLKTLVETQVETVKEMKEIDFSGTIVDPADDNASDGEDLFNDKRRQGRRRNNNDQNGDDNSDVSSVSSYGDAADKGRSSGQPSAPKFREADAKEGSIDIPAFFDDAAEEILAFVKESRYSDATDLWAKAKQEVTDIMQQVRSWLRMCHTTVHTLLQHAHHFFLSWCSMKNLLIIS